MSENPENKIPNLTEENNNPEIKTDNPNANGEKLFASHEEVCEVAQLCSSELADIFKDAQVPLDEKAKNDFLQNVGPKLSSAGFGPEFTNFFISNLAAHIDKKMSPNQPKQI